MYGKMLDVSLFGESHGEAVGVLIEGCPPGIEVSKEGMMEDLQRRKGLKRYATGRKESDEPIILSGVFEGHTTGTPIMIMFENRDVDSSFYEEIKDTPRPGHSDYTARVKYFGYNDYRGGGTFSGRLTAGIVAAGYFAKNILDREGTRIKAYIRSIGGVEPGNVSFADLMSSDELCPDEEAWEDMKGEMERVKDENDSIGGVIEFVALDVPPGLGGPHDEDLEADLSRAFFSIPAVKGVEFGAGFDITKMKGSEANDGFVLENGVVRGETNTMGGVLGGISSGMPIVGRVAFKPTPSIYQEQKTVDLGEMEETTIELKGRFDSCIVPKAVPVVEAKMALVLADKLLRWSSWQRFKNSEER